MAYSIKQLAELAGVSTRTLRYYDQIGLLSPGRYSQAGYRLYGPAEVDLLQQIMFYRTLGFELKQIKTLVQAPAFDRMAALKSHRTLLLARRQQLEALITTIEKTIATEEGGTGMTDQEKFAGFKQQLIEENERKYGQEARQRYGDAAVEAGNARLLQLSQQEYAEMEATAAALQKLLEEAVADRLDPAGPQGAEAARLHQQWLSYSWGSYSEQAHRGLVQMYLDDERFTAYYDKDTAGCAQFLRDAVFAHRQGN